MLKLFGSETRPLLFLAFFMAIFVTASNFLVQFPITFFWNAGSFNLWSNYISSCLSNNRSCKQKVWKTYCRKIVYLGFALGIALTLFFSTNFSDLISIRIAFGSGTAFLVNPDARCTNFDRLRKKNLVCCTFCFIFYWFIVDTFLFFFIILWN